VVHSLRDAASKRRVDSTEGDELSSIRAVTASARHAFLLGALLLVAFAVLATLDAWRDVLHIALRDEEQSQVFLAPVAAGWLLWVRRRRLRHYVPHAFWVGPVVIAVGWALHRAGDVMLLQAAWHFGALLVVVGALLTVFGGGLLPRFFPVLLALCFLVPVPGRVRQGLALPLQSATAEITQSLLQTFGMAAERSGNVLRVDGREVMVAEACNGLRMVFALAIVSFVFAYGMPLRNSVRVLVVLLSPLTAIAFNVVRLVPTVWAYARFPEPVAAACHDVGGWAMLPCAFLVLVGVMRVLRWAQIPITPYILAYAS
jgi:exosortase